MKLLCIITLFLSGSYCFSQEPGWVKTEGEITEITIHNGRKRKEIALVKFKLENGEELSSSVELVRIPFIGSMKSVGDKISINYNRKNPGLLQTTYGKFLSDYGMYILVVLGIIFSLRPILKYRKSLKAKT
ncbi:MAG: hypothetical protein ACJA1C_001594 [Crocinitomicaceae bacterium]|jgi:hypothetical protein